LPTISELRESLADCRVKVSLCLDSDIECIWEHEFPIFIEFSFSIFVHMIKPVIWDKSGKFLLKKLESRLYTRE
jgi:hypothetical protein